MKKVSILGSTGSIGTQTLEIIDLFPEKFDVLGLSAGSNIQLLKSQIEKYKPAVAAVESEELAEELKKSLNNNGTDIVYGPEGYVKVATIAEADTVISSMVGSAGLLPTFEAIKAGRKVCLANKESLVNCRRASDQGSP